MKKNILLLLTVIIVLSGCKPEERETTQEPVVPANTVTTVAGSFNVVDTGQVKCFNSSSGVEVACSGAGYDGDYIGNQPSYSVSDDIVTDNVTGLMWTKSSDLDKDGVTTDVGDKRSQEDSVNYCSNLSLGGYEDWRLPDIKTLYSLILFSGEDPSGYTGQDTNSLNTFLDSSFSRSFGDSSNGERLIDGQYATSTLYVSTTMNGDRTMFGVNFIDGRIKGYPTSMGGEDKLFYVLCVRGNTNYGLNNFKDNGDETITDNGTGLMWQKNDSQSTNFENGVSQCENALTGGYSDWRLPDAKELESIVDYSRSPDTTNSASINEIFKATSFINEEGEKDWGFYWSSTTHKNYTGNGSNGVYLSFGRALGYMNGSIMDVHGAGAQRSNHKDDLSLGGSNSATGVNGAYYYHGPQGDILRLDNMVRCVRKIN
ncbi:MAG: DUF1566 domain-containing protein [Campylobacterales bacterium]|nr:DUF1566 domain-containing protein [Campylobacterales bacterium]